MATTQWQWGRLVTRARISGDALIALALVLTMAGAALATGHSSVGARVAAVAASTGLLVLVLRRRRPLLVLAATFLVVFAEELVAPHAYEVASFLAIMVATYSLGAHASGRSLALGIVIGCGGVAIGHGLGAKTQYSDASSDVFFVLVLVAGPVLVGRLVRARSQLAHRLGEATQRLASARSERIATALTADRAWLSESIDAALLDGLARMARYSECATLEQVSALEGIGRELLGRMRALLKDLRDGGQALEPNGSLTELHARVQRAIEAEAALRTAQGASLAPPRRWTLFSDRVVDRALALVATAVSVGLVLNALGSGAPHVPRWVAALLAVLVTAPIAFARRSALQATVASVLAAFAYVALVRPGDPNSGWLPTGALIVFPLALAVTCSPGRAAAGLGLCVAQFVGLAVVDPAAKLDATTVAPGLAIAVGAWIAGQVLRDRTRLLGALADAAVGIEDERERIGRAALATQRAKVARELHDAVAHAMTVIVLQAGAARRVWESDPELAREHAATLKDTVSEVITELRGMMVALGAGNGHASADLERLVRRAERSGMRVQLEIAGDRSRAEGDVGHTAYRVLQEALTNAARHAPGADVLVRLEFEPSALTVEVANRLPALAPRPTEGAGHGLRGMRERVEGCGGRLFAGARPAGGFAVRAWLPCP